MPASIYTFRFISLNNISSEASLIKIQDKLNYLKFSTILVDHNEVKINSLLMTNSRGNSLEGFYLFNFNTYFLASNSFYFQIGESI